MFDAGHARQLRSVKTRPFLVRSSLVTGANVIFIITSGYVVGYTVFRAMKNKSGEAGHGACTLALSVYNQFMECKLSKNDLTVPGIVGANCKREI